MIRVNSFCWVLSLYRGTAIILGLHTLLSANLAYYYSDGFYLGLFTILCAMAAIQEKIPELLIPFMVQIVVVLVSMALIMIVAGAREPLLRTILQSLQDKGTANNPDIYAIGAAVGIVLNCYFLIVVLSFYDELKREVQAAAPVENKSDESDKKE